MDFARKSLWIMAVIVAVLVGDAQCRPEVKFSKLVELPGMNLSLKIMPESKESPLPPPLVYTYEMQSDGMNQKYEAYLPVDLWRRSQTAIRWVDKYGNILTLAAVTRPLARDYPREHVTRDEYEKKQSDLGDCTQWNEETLARWVADFTGIDSVSGKQALPCPARLSSLVEFEGGERNLDCIVYAFRLNPNAPGQFGAPVNWFCAVLRLNAGMDAEKTRLAMASDFVKSLTVSGKARIARPAVPPGIARVKTQGVATNQAPDFQAGRRQVAESIRNMKDWWFVETKNYIILSNMKSRKSSLFRHLLANVEILRAAFEQFIPPRVELSSVSVIRMFATSEEYCQYVGADMEWTSGCWMPAKKELVIRPVEVGDDSAGKEAVLRTVYHEAFHQYIFYALDGISGSLWFDEGHADFYGAVNIYPDRINIGEDAGRVRVILAMIKAGQIDVKKLLAMSHDEFYSGDKEAIGSHYAMAWGLIYYLRKAAVPGKPFPYSGINDAYCDALVQLRDADQATAKAFENIDVLKLQSDFIAFWESQTRRVQAERNRIFKSFVPSEIKNPTKTR